MLPLETREHGAHIASEEEIAMPVASVAIFPAHSKFVPVSSRPDEDNAINLDL